jgi:hypothetical protein
MACFLPLMIASCGMESPGFGLHNLDPNTRSGREAAMHLTYPYIHLVTEYGVGLLIPTVFSVNHMFSAHIAWAEVGSNSDADVVLRIGNKWTRLCFLHAQPNVLQCVDKSSCPCRRPEDIIRMLSLL